MHLLERYTSTTQWLRTSSRFNSWVANFMMIWMTDGHYRSNIAWILHKRRSLHCPTMDHRLSRNMKLTLYHLSVSSTMTHSLLTKAVSRIVNGFKSRRLHDIITGPYKICVTNHKWLQQSLRAMDTVPWCRHFTGVYPVAGRTTATSVLPERFVTSPARQAGTPHTAGDTRDLVIALLNWTQWWLRRLWS